MDQDQTAYYNMSKTTQKFITDNSGDYAGYVPMTDEQTKMDTNMTGWDEQLTKEQQDNSGITDDQTKAKEIMSAELSQLSLTARSWALKVENHDLEVDWNRTYWDIFHLPNSDAKALCIHLIQSMNPYLADLATYGIDAAALTNGTSKISDFETELGKNKSAQSVITAASAEVAAIIKDDMHPMYERMDSLVRGIYFKNKSTFRNGYFAARKEDALPTHQTTLTVHFVSSVGGADIKGVKLALLDTKKSVLSDAVGVAVLKQFHGGKNLEFPCTHPDYHSQTVIRTITQGKHLEITVQMVPN